MNNMESYEPQSYKQSLQVLKAEKKPDKKKGYSTPSCVETCPGYEPPCPPKKCDTKPKKKPASKKNLTFTDLSASAGKNCCLCCELLTDYLRGVCLLFCCYKGCKYEGKLAEIFCQMLDVAGSLCADCFHMLRYIVRCLVVIKK